MCKLLLATLMLPFSMIVAGLEWPNTFHRNADPAAETNVQHDQFARECMDVGLVVKDADRTVKFYTDLGFSELEGFQLNPRIAETIQLSDGEPIEIRLLAMGEGKSAARLKIVEMRDLKTESADANARLGFRYITLFVSDLQAVLKRLEVTSGSNDGPNTIDIGDGKNSHEPKIAVVRDPDGNLIELVGNGKKSK